MNIISVIKKNEILVGFLSRKKKGKNELVFFFFQPLPTCIMTIGTKNEPKKRIRAFFNQGSQETLILKAIAK